MFYMVFASEDTLRRICHKAAERAGTSSVSCPCIPKHTRTVFYFHTDNNAILES